MADREAIKPNLVRPVYRWFRDQQIRRYRSKTLAVTAAICALRTLSDPEREEMGHWATLLDEGLVTWEAFEEACDQTARQRAQAARRMVERALSAEDEERRTKEGGR